jgi:predicted alpha/beta superfamily hydrolase
MIHSKPAKLRNTIAFSRSVGILPMFVLLLLSASIAEAADVKVTFKVKAPASTPADSKLFVVGDASALGSWGGRGIELTKSGDTYDGTVSLSADQPVEFKITRGSWETVEKNADGSEIANRSYTPKSDATVEITVARWADDGASSPATSKRSTRTGDIRIHSIHSKLLNNDRKLWVCLPPGYDKARAEGYPIFYMHDGQNLFDAATGFAGEWNADETAERLIHGNKIEPLIIVGIENTKDRMTEYTPGERGTLYLRFVAEEVKPFIDAIYHTTRDRTKTAVGGSSLGGLISLYTAQKYPETFGLCAAISPAVWWNKRAALGDLADDPAWMKRTRFWIDTGTDEGRPQEKQVDVVRSLGSLLEKNGLKPDRDFRLSVIEGAKHNEAAWSQRFDQVLLFFFPAK